MNRSFWTTAEGDHEDPIGHRRRWIMTLAVAGILGFLLSGVWGPGTVLGARTTGDPALIAKVHDHLLRTAGLRSLAVVEVDREGVRQAGLGPDSGHWEIGSLTKTFNGHLLADAVTRGDVAMTDTVSRHLPRLTGSAAGSATFEELATHRSGLPRLLPSESTRAIPSHLLNRDPYAATTTPRFLDEVRGVELIDRGEYAYSNVGASLLGHALAAAADQPDWAALARVRLLQPLGMTSTVFATSPAHLPPDAVPGHDAGGRDRRVWISEGQAPAGCCTWTTPEDLARYADALLGGRVPGAEALEPRADAAPGNRVGLFWQISPGPGDRTVTWHRGETAGATSILLLDRDAGRAVIALSNTATPVDGLGAGMIADVDTTSPRPGPLDFVAALVLVVFVVWTVRRIHGARWRTHILRAALDFLAIALLTARIGSWVAVPGWVHGLVVGIGTGALVLGLRRSRELPWASPAPRHDRIQVAVSGGLLVVALILVLS